MTVKSSQVSVNVDHWLISWLLERIVLCDAKQRFYETVLSKWDHLAILVSYNCDSGKLILNTFLLDGFPGNMR